MKSDRDRKILTHSLFQTSIKAEKLNFQKDWWQAVMGTGGIRQRIEGEGRVYWRHDWNDGGWHLRNDMEIQCSENFLEPERVTLVRTPSVAEFEARTSHLL